VKSTAISITSSAILLVAITTAIAAGGQDSSKLAQIEQALKDDIPKLLCVNDSIATSGQPKDGAFAKLAANGFKSVLNLRTASEGVDLAREREMTEKAGLRYISIPVVPNDPRPEQVDEFIRAMKDSSAQPMLIHCGSANRVGGFWMIYRVVGQGWAEDKALEEATKIGLTSPTLKKFAQDYIANHKKAGK
jgi:uncharacterized protein (TIGR01244 family)